MSENDPFAKEDKKVDTGQNEETINQTEGSGKGPGGRFLKGHTYAKGRPKGSVDKFTNLKKHFLAVFEKIESESELTDNIDSFYDWATKNTKNQTVFYTLLARMLPTNVNFEGDIPVTFEISEKFMPQKEKSDDEK